MGSRGNALDAGAVLQGNYVLLERIPSEDGELFSARHLTSGARVSVRFGRPRDARDRNAFLAAAKVAQTLRQPSLSATLGFGEHEDGTCFLITEQVSGLPLLRFIDELGIPQVPSVLALGAEACDALRTMRESGLPCDVLRPDDVLVTATQVEALGQASYRFTLLDVATPAFMRADPWHPKSSSLLAPEQIARLLTDGERAEPYADARALVYQVGGFLYALCTGGLPGAVDKAESLDDLALRQSTRRLVPPSRINPKVPHYLDAAVVRALSLDPAARQASLSELVEALSPALAAQSGSGVRPRVSLPPPLPQPPPPLPQVSSTSSTSPPPPPSQSWPPRERRSVAFAPLGSFSSGPPPAEDARVTLEISPALERDQLDSPRALGKPAAISRVLMLALASAALLLAFVRLSWSPKTSSKPAAHVTPTSTVLTASSRASMSADTAARHATGTVHSATPTPVIEPATTAVADGPAPSTAQLDVSDASPAARRARAAERRTSTTHVPARTRQDKVVDIRPQAIAHGAPLPVSVPTPPPAQIAATPSSSVLPVNVVQDAGSPSETPPAPVLAAASATPARHVEVNPAPAAPSVSAPARPLRARVEELSVRGSLVKSVVRRAVQRLLPRFDACASHAHRSAGGSSAPSDRTRVSLEIDVRGRARSVETSGSARPGLDACISRAATHLVSDEPPDTGTVFVSWNVVFSP